MKRIFIVALLSSFLFGCATTGPRIDPLADFHEAKPHSILVLPVANQSVDVMASTSVLTTLPKILGEKGYYIFPVNTVKSLLEFEGFSDPQEIHNQPPEEIAGLFSADSILYVTIHSWTAKYLVVSTTTEVDLEYRIVNKNGHEIFADRKLLQYTPQSSGSSDNLFADLIVNAIVAAVERAAPDYLPLTREANQSVFLYSRNPLPPGPYHPNFATYYETVVETYAPQPTEPDSH